MTLQDLKDKFIKNKDMVNALNDAFMLGFDEGEEYIISCNKHNTQINMQQVDSNVKLRLENERLQKQLDIVDGALV